jgi:CheY-like chemotaxis protein
MKDFTLGEDVVASAEGFPYFWDRQTPNVSCVAWATPVKHDRSGKVRSTGGQPAATNSVAPVAPDQRKQQGMFADAGESARTCVLLVDDHPDSLRSMARLLRSFGYSCRMAECGEAARELAEIESFDILVTDLYLPDISGKQLVEEFARRFHIPSIVVSGAFPLDCYGETPLCVAFLVKPVDVDHLHRAIQRALNH